MQHSGLEKLWEGTQSLSNLKWMDLSGSGRLKELPDFSTATNLYDLNLKGCSSLVDLPFSIGNAINHRKFNLRYFLSLVLFPYSTIWNIVTLEEVDLKYWSSLVEDPSSTRNIVNLTNLDLSGCSRLVKLPSIENATNLRKLDLSYCSSLVKLPSSIGNAINLQELDLSYCSKLTKLPSSMRNIGRLSKLELKGCSKLEVVLANINMESLEELNLSDCSLLKSYPKSSTEIREIDPWIGRVSILRRLVLSGMKKLVSLPQLPDSLLFLEAENCESLERLDFSFRNPDICLNFINCFKLNQEARDLIIQTRSNKYAVFPGREVPQCFPCRSYGSSLTVKMNQKPLVKSIKFKACICACEEKRISDWGYVGYIIRSRWNFITSAGKRVDSFSPGHLYTFEVEVETEKLTSTEFCFEFVYLQNWRYDQESHYNYQLENFSNIFEIKECGILQILEVPSTEL